MKIKLIALSLLCATILTATPNDDATSDRGLAYIDASTSLIMDNKYIKVGVSQDGTFGIGNGSTPGMLYDETGMANYTESYDYLTPGSPFESWVVQYDTDSSPIIIGSNNDYYMSQNNSYIKDSNVTTLNLSEDGNITSVLHQANIDDKLLLKQVYTVNKDTQFISIVSTLTNTSSATITGLKFARGLDPDPDTVEYGTPSTVNQRGFEIVDESGSITTIPKKDIAFTVGVNSGHPVGIYSFSDIPHNAMINNTWSQDPDVILLGDSNESTGDYVISLAFDFDTLEANESIEFRYGYMFGTDMNNSVEEVIETVKEEDEKYDFINSIEGFAAGWYMLGLEAGVPDMTTFDKEYIDLVWKYSNTDGWSVYTNKHELSPDQKVIDSIAPNEGFWIKKLY